MFTHIIRPAKVVKRSSLGAELGAISAPAQELPGADTARAFVDLFSTDVLGSQKQIVSKYEELSDWRMCTA